MKSRVNPLSDQLGYMLRRVAQLSMAKLSARLAQFDLTPTESAILLIIDANPGITQSEISLLLNAASSNLMPRVARLRRSNLVVRETIDGRTQALHLSPEGKRLTARMRNAIEQHEHELLQTVPRSRRTDFIAALNQLLSQWGDSR
jgi:DNA-binding MarR family transcriptional regulator